MATFDIQQQNAIYADFNRYANPFEFLAERLREENIHIELAKQEMRMASTLIQARNRGIRDRKRVEEMKHDIATTKAATIIQARERGKEARKSAQYKRSMTHTWLYELFLRMASSKTTNVPTVVTASLVGYIVSDPDVIESMNLPRRFVRIPTIFATTSRSFVQGFRADARTFPRAAIQTFAATKIQALQRGKNDRKPKGDTSPPAAEGGGLGMFSMFQRCMTGENDLPPARE